MRMRRTLALILSLLLAFLPVTPALADTLSVSAWSTGDALSSVNLNSRMTSITTWSTNIANDNIKSTAAVVGSKLDLTSGTGRISQSTSVTSDSPVFTSATTFDNIATAFSAWRLTVTNTNSASTSRLIELRVGSTIIASISRVGQLMLTPQNYASGPTTLMEGAWFNVASATMTDNMTAASGVKGNAPGSAGTNGGEKLLQFTSARHVLGFAEDGVIVASARHMLRIDFLNSRAVAPEADNGVS